MVEVSHTEATLDSRQLSRQDWGRSFRLTGRLLTARLLATLPNEAGFVPPAPRSRLGTATGASRRDSRDGRRLVYVHQRGHRGRETRLHAVKGPKRVSLLGKSPHILIVVFAESDPQLSEQPLQEQMGEEDRRLVASRTEL
jgi:hypothetical protein